MTTLKLKFLHRYTNAVIRTEEVPAGDDNPTRAALRQAVSSDANLSDANLRGANLSDANLSDANLRGADLSDANLRGANLSDANLSDANLSGADLSDANLSGADLRDANLSDANLRGANLSGADLSEIRDDIRAILDHAPGEVAGLLAKLRAGEINGSCYEGSCACLVGTIANLRGCGYESLPGIAPNGGRPAERWFLALRPGITPETHPVALITERWITDWMAEHGQVVPSRPRHLSPAEIADLRAMLGLLTPRGEEILAKLGWVAR